MTETGIDVAEGIISPEGKASAILLPVPPFDVVGHGYLGHKQRGQHDISTTDWDHDCLTGVVVGLKEFTKEGPVLLSRGGNLAR